MFACSDWYDRLSVAAREARTASSRTAKNEGTSTPKRRMPAYAAAGVAFVLTFFSGLTHPVAAERPKPVTLAVSPTEATVLAAPCGLHNLDITITNTTSQARYVDVYVLPGSPLRTTTDLISTYLPANDDVVEIGRAHV